MTCGSVVPGFVLSKSEPNNPWPVLDEVISTYPRSKKIWSIIAITVGPMA